jgi:hypothetical protein
LEAREIVDTRGLALPGVDFHQAGVKEDRELITALTDWRVTLRPEVVQLRNWPNVKPEHFLRKTVWQKFFDHVIRNQDDLENELDYILINPVKEGYVKYPQFYPFSGIL